MPLSSIGLFKNTQLFLISIVLMLMISACGGGGGNSRGEAGAVTSGTSIWNGLSSSSNESNSSSSGIIASFHKIQIPVGKNYDLYPEGATNDGMYFKAIDFDSETAKVIKAVGIPSSVNDWIVANFDSTISDIAIANPYSEPHRTLGFYWISNNKYGLYSANNDVPSYKVQDDMRIYRVAAGGVEGVITPRPWVVARGAFGGDTKLFQDDGTSSGSFAASDAFSTAVAVISNSGERGELLSDPNSPTMYIGTEKIDVYTSSGLMTSFPLSGDAAYLGAKNFTWYQGKLWFSAAGSVYRFHNIGGGMIEDMANHTNSTVADINDGSFCINGGEIFFSDGTAVNILTKSKRDWIANGSFSLVQQAELDIFRSSINGNGIYCSPDTTASVIYSYHHIEKVLIAIIPLPTNDL